MGSREIERGAYAIVGVFYGILDRRDTGLRLCFCGFKLELRWRSRVETRVSKRRRGNPVVPNWVPHPLNGLGERTHRWPDRACAKSNQPGVGLLDTHKMERSDSEEPIQRNRACLRTRTPLSFTDRKRSTGFCLGNDHRQRRTSAVHRADESGTD